MVGVALPSIGTELHLATSSLQWIVSGYVLGYGGLLLLGGRTADLLGRRRGFLIALAGVPPGAPLRGLLGPGAPPVAPPFLQGGHAPVPPPARPSLITTTLSPG